MASSRSCMTGRGMQDKALRVSVHTCDVLTLTARLTPQGPPSMYGSLETPCGQKFEVVPESYLLRGATSAFCFAAAGADPGLTTVVVGCRRHGEDLTASVTASVEWWGRSHSEADLLATFRRCFPHLPLVWIHECVHAALAAGPKDLRCGAGTALPPALGECARLPQGTARLPDASPGSNAAVIEDVGGGVREAGAGQTRATSFWQHACRQSKFVKCNKLGSGRAVLVGDAAHAMSPTIGMGCNTALLDGQALAAAAVAAGGDVGAIEAHLTREHLPDVHAVLRVARRMYDAKHLRFHGNCWRAFQGWLVSQSFALAGPSQRLPGPCPSRAASTVLTALIARGAGGCVPGECGRAV